jgi:hypothetical protein
MVQSLIDTFPYQLAMPPPLPCPALLFVMEESVMVAEPP